jgi:hypothetical protein
MDYHVTAEVFDAMTMHPRVNRPRTFFSPGRMIAILWGIATKFSFSLFLKNN